MSTVDILLGKINKVVASFKEKEVPAYKLDSQASNYTGNKIPTGIPKIDALTHGGFPCGKLIEVFGGESSGKTTLCLTMFAGAVRRNPDCSIVYIDAEHALDINYAKRIGISTQNVIVQQPDYGEQALELVKVASEEFISIKEANPRAQLIIVVDSVAALVPKSEFESETIEETGGLGSQARMMSIALRKLLAPIHKSDACVVFINQIRDKIGGYGASIDTPAGRALKFYSTLRIQLTKIGKWDDVDGGIKTKMTIVKSKLFPPFSTEEFCIGPDGIDPYFSIVELALDLGVIKKSGPSFDFNGIKVQGKYNFSQRMRSDKDLAKNVVDAINIANKAVQKPSTLEDDKKDIA